MPTYSIYSLHFSLGVTLGDKANSTFRLVLSLVTLSGWMGGVVEADPVWHRPMGKTLVAPPAVGLRVPLCGYGHNALFSLKEAKSTSNAEQPQAAPVV